MKREGKGNRMGGMGENGEIEGRVAEEKDR